VRIVHLADSHLGMRQLRCTDSHGRNIREKDFAAGFAAAIERAIELQPACVIHAGDLFDSYHPSAAALTAALDGITRLSRAEVPFIVISGNHSTPRVAAAQHIFDVLGRFGGNGLVHAVSTEPRIVRIGGLAVHALPHHNDRDVLAGYMRDARPCADADRNVVVAHTGFLALDRVGAGEAGSVSLSGEELEAVGTFDYVALGHLHKYDRVRTNAVYSGSVERVTWADDARRKGIVEVDLDIDPFDDAWHQLHEIPSRAHIALPPIDAADASDVSTAIIEAAERRDDLAEAMVRLRVDNLTLSAQAAIDRTAIERAYAECLHFELDARLIGERTAPAGPRDLREFLAGRAPQGMDPGDFIARAETYLAQATQEIGA
jgi:exonuclease SbcD